MTTTSSHSAAIATDTSSTPRLDAPDEHPPTPVVRGALLVVMVASLGVLASAFAAQNWFGLTPCVLCLIQRIPYALTASFAAIGLLVPLGDRVPRIILMICAALFALGATIAAYHVGVEAHWWASIAGCGGTPVTGLDPANLASAPMVAIRPCDQVDWRFAGVTLAGYNAILSTGAAIACLITARRARRTASLHSSRMA